MKMPKDNEKALRELAIDLLGHASDAQIMKWRPQASRELDDNALSGATTGAYSSPIQSVQSVGHLEWGMEGQHLGSTSPSTSRPMSGREAQRPHTSQGVYERPGSALSRPGSAMSGGGSRPGSASPSRRTGAAARGGGDYLQTPEQQQLRRRRRRMSPVRAMREAGREDPIYKGVSLSPLHDNLLRGSAWEEDSTRDSVSPQRSFTWYPVRKVDSRRRVKQNLPGPADYTPRWVANPGASFPHGRTTRVLARTNRRFRPSYAEIEASLVPSPAAYQKLAEAGSTHAAMRPFSKFKGSPAAAFGTAVHPLEDLYLLHDGTMYY